MVWLWLLWWLLFVAVVVVVVALALAVAVVDADVVVGAVCPSSLPPFVSNTQLSLPFPLTLAVSLPHYLFPTIEPTHSAEGKKNKNKHFDDGDDEE